MKNTHSTDPTNGNVTITTSPMKDDATILEALAKTRETPKKRVARPLTGRRRTSDALLIAALRLRQWSRVDAYDEDFAPSHQKRLEAGRVHLVEGRYDEAIAEFEKVDDEGPAEARARFFRGVAYLERGELLKCSFPSDEYIPEGIEREALELYKGLLKIGLEDRDAACRELCMLCAFIYNYFLGIAELAEWPIEPSENDAVVSEGLQTWSEIERLIAQLDYEPEDMPYRQLFKGRAYLEFDCPQQAVEGFNLAAIEDPSLDEPWFFRSMAHRQLGNSSAAEADLRQAEQLTPGISAHAERWWQEWQARLDRRRHPPHPWKSSNGCIVVPEEFSVIHSAE